MKICPYCAEEIQEDAVFCRYCQTSLVKKRSNPIFLFLAIVLAALILFFGDSYLNRNPPGEWLPSGGSTNPTSNKSHAPPGCPGGCEDHPSGCDIKGSLTVETHVKLYYLPDSVMYEAIQIDPPQGGRWFCSEDEARQSGWASATE